MAEIILTKENFENEVMNSEIPVLVDFFAVWCGPCKMLAPILAEFAEENEGKVKVCKVNVDDEGELAQRFGVMSIPTLVVFKNGEETAKSIGFVDKSGLAALIEK